MYIIFNLTWKTNERLPRIRFTNLQYPVIMNDTSPAAHKKQLEIIMSKTPQERFMMGIEMMDSVYAIVKKSILQQNPNISSDELQVAIFKRYYRKDFSPELLERICQSMRLFWAKKV